MKQSVIWAKQRKDFFKRRFNELYSEWKKRDKGNTQGEFARQICEIRNKNTGEKCPVTNSYVSEWKRGKWVPDQYIPEIAKVLGVKEEEFSFNTHDDLYRHSSEYITEFGRSDLSQFCYDIGLNLQFLSSIRKLIGPDFDSMFPIYLPIPDREECMLPNKRKLADSAPIDNMLQYLQVERDGKTITLHKCDLAYLKEVQDQIVEFVSYLFYKRSEEMKKEALLFNDDFQKLHPDLGPAKAFETGSDFMEERNRIKGQGGESTTIPHKPLEDEVMKICQKYDRFMPFFTEETTKRKATQGDIDRFFNGTMRVDGKGITITRKGGK